MMIASRAVALLLILAACLYLSGCCCRIQSDDVAAGQSGIDIGSEAVAEEPQQEESAVQASDHPVVGHLKTRDKLITIRSGPDGPLYTVKSQDGRVLAVDLPASQLATRFPGLEDIVEGGIADWAGIDEKYRSVQSPANVAPYTRDTTTVIIDRGSQVGR